MRRPSNSSPTPRPCSLPDVPDGREVKLCGIITAVKSMLTKKGDRMAYITLEDLHGL
jgi:DNA polymerase-3 subunit alpha